MTPLRWYSKCAAKKRSWFCLIFCHSAVQHHPEISLCWQIRYVQVHICCTVPCSMYCTVCWFYWLLCNCRDRDMSWDNFSNLSTLVLVWTVRLWAYAGMCSCSCSLWNSCSMFSPPLIVVVSLESVPFSGCPSLCRTSEHEWNRLSYYAKLPDWFDLSGSQHAVPPKYLL